MFCWLAHTWWTVHGNKCGAAIADDGCVLNDDRSGRMTVVLNVGVDDDRVRIADVMLLLLVVVVLLLNLNVTGSGGRTLSGCFLP